MQYDGMISKGERQAVYRPDVGLYGLPVGFEAVQGPSGWRPVPGVNPLDRAAASDAKAEAMAALFRQMKRKPIREKSKRKRQKEMSRLMDQYVIAQELGALNV